MNVEMKWLNDLESWNTMTLWNTLMFQIHIKYSPEREMQAG